MIKKNDNIRWKSLILIIFFIIISNYSYCQITVTVNGTKKLNFGSFVTSGSGTLTLNPLATNKRTSGDQVIIVPSSTYEMLSITVKRGTSGQPGIKTVYLTFNYSPSLGPNLSFVITQPPTFGLDKNGSTTFDVGGVLTVSGPVSAGTYSSGTITITGTI